MLGITRSCNTSSQLRWDVRVSGPLPSGFSWRDLAFLFGTSTAPLLSTVTTLIYLFCLPHWTEGILRLGSVSVTIGEVLLQ